MPEALPRRTKEYVGPVTNTDIWAGFELRANDVLVCTPPKCGTTWMQTLVAMLLSGRADPAAYERPVSPWLDCGFRDRADIAQNLARQTGRRCIKSHTPLDGILFAPDATYLMVYRHPIDVHFSMRDHVANMREDWLDFLYEGDVRMAFRRFVDFPATDAGTDDLTLASIAAHYRSFQAWAALPNLHFFHYADMRRDLPGQVRRLAGILGLSPSADFLDRVAEAGTFGRMQAHAAEKPARSGSAFKDDARFFASGSSGKWQGALSEADLAHYEARADALLSPADRQWLEWGDVPEPGLATA